MKIRFILGKAGSGKTELCLKEISKKQNIGTDRALIYIVPEQFSMQSEKNLIERVEGNVLISSQVLSFKRLSYHLFSEVGGVHRNILEELGKVMLVRKIVYSIKDEIIFFRNSIDKQGFLDNLSETISEFYHYNITPEALGDAAEKVAGRTNLYLKLKDIQKIYSHFRNYIQEKYISTDEMLDISAEKICESRYLQNAEIWIDGFTGFTPQEYKVINRLSKKASILNIALTADEECTGIYEGINSHDPYYETKNTVNRIYKMALENKLELEPSVFLGDTYASGKSKELVFLGQNYFKYEFEGYGGENKDIRIFSANHKYTEIAETARNIVSLVRDKGYRFKEIAVINADTDYKKQLATIFKQFDIPFFMDIKKDISSHPLAELIRSLLDIVITNKSYEAVFRFLKTSLTPIPISDVTILENYVLAFGIKGHRWEFEEWNYGFGNNGQFEGMRKEDINYIKNCVKDILTPFTSQIKNNKKYTVKEISIKIYEFLGHIGVTNTLASFIDEANSEFDFELAGDHRKIWRLILSVFEKMVDILGEERVSISEYSKILNAGFSTCNMGSIPATADQVIIGDIERSRLPSLRALFVVGANDGVLPSFSEENGIFSDFERETFDYLGLELAHNSKRKISEEQFLIYSTLTKPSQLLQLSYSTGTLDGKPKRRSSVIDRLRSLFPYLKEISESSGDADNIDAITMAKPTFEAMGAVLSDYMQNIRMPDVYKDAYNWFCESGEYRHLLEQLIGGTISSYKHEDYLTPETVKKLYGKNLQSSVSKLEKFAMCPFSFFVQYGLRARERKIYKISPPDLGSLFHKVLEDFSLTLNKENMRWRDLSRAQIDGIIEKSIDDLAPSLGSEILLSSERYKYLIKRIKRITKRSVWALSEHIKMGVFEPVYYEIGFGHKEKLPPIVIELSEGSSLVLTGKIDRVDILDSGGKKYVKIIDYKSGTKKYDLQDIYYGMQLQLVLYLDSFIKNYKIMVGQDILPGGMFYFKIDDPLLTVGHILSDEELEKTLLNSFKLSGLVLNDESVARALDSEGMKYSLAAPLYFNKEGGISEKSSSVADMEKFSLLREFVCDTVKNVGGEIIKGNIKIQPYKKKEQTGCDFCIYKSVCKFEPSGKKHAYRNIKPLEDVWGSIAEAMPSTRSSL